MDLEQFILHFNPDLSSVYQLQSLCQILGFQAVYTQLNNSELQQERKSMYRVKINYLFLTN